MNKKTNSAEDLNPLSVERIALDAYDDAPERPSAAADETASYEAELRPTRALAAARQAAREVGFALAGFTFEIPPEVIRRFLDEAIQTLRAEMLDGLHTAAESPYMTVREAAAYARTSPDRIRKLRSRGVLGRYGDGGRALVKREELEAWIQNEPRRGRRD